MDIFDPMHICNHSDEEGRYAYRVGSLECSSVADVDIILVLVPAGNDVSILYLYHRAALIVDEQLVCTESTTQCSRPSCRRRGRIG